MLKSYTKFFVKGIAVCTFLLTALASDAQQRWYVSNSGTPSGNATSWSTASNDLQLVINGAAAGDSIWVAKGTYVPLYSAATANTSSPVSDTRNNSFVLKDNVTLIGGFAGTESSILEWTPNNGSILSGDLGTIGTVTDNAYNVVIAVGTTTTKISVNLNGFTISGGYGAATNLSYVLANGVTFSRTGGAGLFANYANLKFTNLLFDGNSSTPGTGTGGGLSANNATSLVVSNSTFQNNAIAGGNYGTGVYVSTIASSSFSNVTFSNNSIGTGALAVTGAADNSLSVVNCRFTGNKSTYSGAGIHLRVLRNISILGSTFMDGTASGTGGIYQDLGTKSTITNCIFTNNSATGSNGGSIYINGNGNSLSSGTNTEVKLDRNIFNGNRSSTWGGAIFNNNGLLTIYNSLFYRNAAPDYGGGIFTDGASANTSIYNSTFANNVLTNATPGSQGYALYNSGGGTFLVANSIITGIQSSVISNGLYSTPTKLTITNSYVKGDIAGNGATDPAITAINNAITTEPAFVDSANGNFHLSAGSSAIDAGSDADYTAGGGNLSNDNDLAGNARIGGAAIDLGAYEYGTTTPIELEGFQAKANGTKVLLIWNTKTETNNQGFEIQHSADGKSFVTIGFVNGYGTTSISQSYDYTDVNPVTGVNYYRLKQRDFDGRSTYSQVETITLNAAKVSFKIYPNPAASYIKVDGAVLGGSILIYDLSGKLVKRVVVNGSSSLEISLEGLHSGVYILKYGDVSRSFIKK